VATGKRQEAIYPEESEANLAVLYQNAPVIMFLVDEERRIFNLNPFTAAFADCPAAEVIGRRGGEVLHCRYCDGDSGDCGSTPACRQCRLRQTVRDTFETGQDYNNVEINLSVKIKEEYKEVYFLLSTKKLVIGDQPLVLVCLFDITERKLMEEALQESYVQIEALSKRTLNAMEEERKRLARELHDEVGQALTAVKLDLQMIHDDLAGFIHQRERVAKGITLVDRTLQLVRQQSVSLRPPVLDDLGLESAIRDMVQGFKERTGIQTTVRAYGFSKRLPPEMETALYRCVQESLTNIMRHARASRVTVTLVHNAQGLTVQIEDNGIGFDPGSICVSPDHTGLTGMRERVKLLGGELIIESEKGRGTRITIKIPCTNQK